MPLVNDRWTFEDFKDALTEAGNNFDGHVTVGSLQEQLRVLREYLGLEEKGTVQFNHPNFKRWMERVMYEIPEWSWQTDPYCAGMNKATHDYLLNLDHEKWIELNMGEKVESDRRDSNGKD